MHCRFMVSWNACSRDLKTNIVLTFLCRRRYRTLLDRSTPLTVQRWLFTGVVLLIFLAVVLIRQGVSLVGSSSIPASAHCIGYSFVSSHHVSLPESSGISVSHVVCIFPNTTDVFSFVHSLLYVSSTQQLLAVSAGCLYLYSSPPDALAIYLLNLFLAFLQPKFDPSMQQDLAAEDVEEGAPGLPGANTGSSQKGGKCRRDFVARQGMFAEDFPLKQV